MATARPPVTRPPVDKLTRYSFALGGVAYGVKGNGYSYFLMLCYGQAFGMPSEQVGLALMLAFIFDAISDPLVGYLSDNTKGPLGRRHTYMYAAILPVGIGYWFLWNPPDALVAADTTTALFWYLVVFAIGVRLLITFYEVPCTALAAELTTDYDDRTRLLTLRSVTVFAGGVIMAASTLYLILENTEEGSAFTDTEGFGRYGLVAAGVIMASMLTCAIGTHRYLPHLHKAATTPSSFRKGLAEVYETLKNPSLMALFLSQLSGAAAFGVGAALIYYIHGFFWAFESWQSATVTASVLISAILALFIGPNLSQRIGKRQAAVALGLTALVFAVAPVGARLIGVMPPNESPAVFAIVLVSTLLEYTAFIAMSALVSSMIADLAEDTELRTGRRAEGVLFAVRSFARKAVEGVGVMAAALILTLISFPEGRDPGEVPQAAIDRLGLFYFPVVLVLWLGMVILMLRYRINREDHEANLDALAARAAAQTEDP